ncbi:hypothetical protein IFM89_007277 [Coptis chinensis]|uniref:OTU domain-containing protein n=1 Tax=Coptis chinensis TaxID=261450 RepID=A0A835ILR6_9MAGN|nr:hypothetical protein IFM89_007277 [Coptis chinensis]
MAKKKDEPDLSEIKKQAQNALNVHQRGDHSKALSLIEKSLSKFKRYANACGDLYRIQAAIYKNLADMCTVRKKKKKCLKNAVESARMAASSSHRSLEFFLCYANLLYETLGSTPDGIEKISAECNRAYAIDEPIDPSEGIIQDEGIMKISSPQERIVKVKKQLSDLSDRVWGRSSSTTSETANTTDDLENEEKGKKILDDPLEGQFKKTTKTKEERRKEKQVTAADLFGVDNPSGPVSHCPRMERLMQKKNTQNFLSGWQKKQKIAPYFRSLSQDQMKNLLEVSTKHLLDYYSKQKDKRARDVISEALAFVRENSNWKFRMCCCCSKPFANDRLHIEHLMEKNHIEVLSTEQGSVQCLALDRYWKAAIKGRTWIPINTSAALPIVEAQWNSELRKSNPWEWATTEKWPVSDDHERKDSLELIQKLLQGTNLAAEHMDMVIEYTMKNIEDLHPGLGDKFRQVGLDKTHFCICMLGASELDTVHEFFKELQELYKNNSAIRKIPMPITMDLIEDRILLNGDSLCLLFGKNSLQGGSTSGTYTEKSSHIDKNASSATYAPEIDDSVSPNSDALLTLIFEYLSIEEQLMSWTWRKENKVNCGKELLRELQNTYNILLRTCEEKLDKLSYKEALKAITGLCLEEAVKRKSASDNDHQSYKTVLRSRHQELEKGNDASRRNKCELKAISTVIEEAELKKHISREQSRNRAINTICDWESSKDMGFKLQKDLDEDAIEVEGAIERVRRRADFELIETGARMMSIWEDESRITNNITLNSYNDYREILLPLVKSYLQELLKELADKDAIEISEAAEKAILDQLQNEKQKSNDAGGKQPKPTRKISKTKNKRGRRRSGLKVTSDANDRLPLQGTSEQDRSSVASDGHTDLGSAEALPGEDMDQQGEPYQRGLKEGAVIPTHPHTLKQSCAEDVSSVDNTEAGSNSHIQKEIMRRSLCEAAQFVEDFEKQEEQSQLEMQEAATVPTQDVSTLDQAERGSRKLLYKNVTWLGDPLLAQVLHDRWVSAINAYNDPTIDSHSESRNPAADWIPDCNDQSLLHGTAEEDHHTDLENITALPGENLDKQGELSQLGEIQANRTFIIGDGRCLFRAVALGFRLRNGEEAPDEDFQGVLADDLRMRVADELVKRRSEPAVMRIEEAEGSLEDYLDHIRKPRSWGGEPELLMAAHVLRAPISVFQDGIIGYKKLTDYGEEYKEEGKALIMLYFHRKNNHYDLLQTPN